MMCNDIRAAAVQAREALPELIDRYWSLAYAEGAEGRTHDTKDGAAQQTRGEIDAALRAISAALAAAPAPMPRTRVLPHPGSPEASAMMDSLLAEYNWPTNTKNAARAGWEAANRWLAASPSPQQDGPSDAEMLDWLTRRIGGIALRDAGVAWPAWSPEYAREAIRAAMRGDTGGKTE